MNNGVYGEHKYTIPDTYSVIMLSTLLKSSVVRKVCDFSSKVVFFRSQPSSTAVPVTLKDTPFAEVIKDVYKNDDSCVLSGTLQRFGLKDSPLGTDLLQQLKKAKTFKLSEDESAVKAFNICSSNFGVGGITPQTVYVRSFYDRLLKVMWRNRRAVLLGNPGVSKSWFQLYMMYRLVNEEEYNTKLIIRQRGAYTVDFYFPSQGKAFTSSVSSLGLVRYLKPDTSVYLFEPVESLIEPSYSLNYGIRSFSMCSPNEVRYKEFCKNGAITFYMPCWTLKELKSVGSHVAKVNPKLKDFMHPQAIEERYERFGGIIRYVIPISKMFLDNVKAEQDSVLKRTKAVDALVSYASIEKSDDCKQIISDFILTYDVEYGDKYKNGMGSEEFFSFRMKIASEYVKSNLDGMSDHDLIVTKKSEFTRDPLLFNAVVYNTIVNGFFKWQVFDQGKWIDHDWGLTKKQIVNVQVKNGELIEDGE